MVLHAAGSSEVRAKFLYHSTGAPNKQLNFKFFICGWVFLLGWAPGVHEMCAQRLWSIEVVIGVVWSIVIGAFHTTVEALS